MPLRPARFCITFALLSGMSLIPGQAASSSGADDDMRSSVKKFTSVYEALESNFADKVDTDRAVYHGAIPAMLRTLDPHSNFFDPKANEAFRENQAGHYFGVGMYIWSPEGKVLVSYPFVGSPAYKAGLRPGDQLLEINGKSAEKLTVPEVSALLKGPRGTSATIKVKREGKAEPLEFDLIRQEVPRASVSQAYWYRPGIAYIRIDQFTETTSREVDNALKRLGEANIQGLILDLRDNPGGLVQEAVGVADRFLRKGQIVVTHHGRTSNEAKFTAKTGERGPEYPMVVMVNRGTASAAEILAGALQDHDRAWILGENTFGKGLVQAPFPLSGDSTLLLTIAKYYTPSGRLIQRDYHNRGLYEYLSRPEGHNNYEDKRKTDSGRPVFGGDGISPDQIVSAPKASPLEAALVGRLAFYYFAPRYFTSHSLDMNATWTPDSATLTDFKELARKRGVVFTDTEFDKNLPWIEKRLREELLITAQSKDAADRASLNSDPEIEKAMAALPASKALLEQSHDIVARGTNRQASPTVAVP